MKPQPKSGRGGECTAECKEHHQGKSHEVRWRIEVVGV